MEPANSCGHFDLEAGDGYVLLRGALLAFLLTWRRVVESLYARRDASAYRVPQLFRGATVQRRPEQIREKAYNKAEVDASRVMMAHGMQVAAMEDTPVLENYGRLQDWQEGDPRNRRALTEAQWEFVDALEAKLRETIALPEDFDLWGAFICRFTPNNHCHPYIRLCVLAVRQKGSVVGMLM